MSNKLLFFAPWVVLVLCVISVVGAVTCCTSRAERRQKDQKWCSGLCKSIGAEATRVEPYKCVCGPDSDGCRTVWVSYKTPTPVGKCARWSESVDE